MKLLSILGIALLAHVATASLFGGLIPSAVSDAAALAAKAAAAAQSALNSAGNAAQAVSNGASIILGSSITLSLTASTNFGGTFSDLFGSLTSLMAAVPDGAGGLVSANLASSVFLLTGIDPFFVTKRDVFFILYTNQNPNGQNITASTIGSSTYNSSNPTRFIIHGYLNNGKSPMNVEIPKAYLAVGNFNVIVVDWGYGAFDVSYINARLRVNAVSIEVSFLINSMISNNQTTYNQVVIVGHSLGGQTAGLTAKKITGGKILAVIALDAAGPLFPLQPSKATVQPTDAQYVEAHHCNGGGFGMLAPIAQADFFINWGTLQTGCVDLLMCPHLRCYDYFAQSVAKPNKFIAKKCASYSEITGTKCTDQGGKYVMGGEAPNSGISGVFFVATAGSSPYALG